MKITGSIEIELDDGETLHISKVKQENKVGLYFLSGEGGYFSLEDFAELILKFYKDKF